MDRGMKRGPKPVVEYAGNFYTCRRYNVELPDLQAMTRVEALVWLNRNTTAKGYTRDSGVNLRGLNLQVVTR